MFTCSVLGIEESVVPRLLCLCDVPVPCSSHAVISIFALQDGACDVVGEYADEGGPLLVFGSVRTRLDYR